MLFGKINFMYPTFTIVEETKTDTAFYCNFCSKKLRFDSASIPRDELGYIDLQFVAEAEEHHAENGDCSYVRAFNQP